jgi:hypothetical protein
VVIFVLCLVGLGFEEREKGKREKKEEQVVKK